jgi:cytosine/adenosine deaminase-related metal-dependent hydrolase
MRHCYFGRHRTRRRGDRMSLLIRDAVVLTVDGSGTIHNPGAVFVEGKRIADVGPSDAVAARHSNAARVIDGRGKVVAPGFVNIHSDVRCTIFRGRSEDAGFAAPAALYFPMSTVMTREDRAAVGVARSGAHIAHCPLMNAFRGLIAPDQRVPQARHQCRTRHRQHVRRLFRRDRVGHNVRADQDAGSGRTALDRRAGDADHRRSAR